MRADPFTRVALATLTAATLAGCASAPPPTELSEAGVARPLLSTGAVLPTADDAATHRPAAVSARMLADGPFPMQLAELPRDAASPVRSDVPIDPDEGIESPVPREVLERQRAEALAAPPALGIQGALPSPAPPEPGPALISSFDAVDVAGCCASGSVVPPDPELAAGPNHLVAVVNLSVAIFDKSGTPLASPIPLTAFFSGVTGCTSWDFDPNVLYDEEADRFIVGADGGFERYCVAATTGGDPTGGWYRYSFPTDYGGPGFDYPSAGVGREAIYVGANQFSGSTGAFLEGRVYAIEKAALYAGGTPLVSTRGLGSNGTTPQPANVHGYLQGTWPTDGPHYIVSDRFDGARHAVWAWTDPFGADQLVELAALDLKAATGGVGGQAISASQNGTGLLEGNDWRGLDTEYRNGRLWVTNTMSCNPGSGVVNCVRWAEIDPAGPSLVQAGLFASDGEHRIFPDLAANHCDDVAIGYTVTSPALFPSIHVTGRTSDDAAGTLRAETLLKSGEDEYTAFDGSPYRWGDYTGMTTDPDGLTFWYLGEYSRISAGSARWATRIGSFELPGCPVLVLAPQAGDFGAVEVGSGSAPIELLLANLGNDSATVTAMSLSNGADFTLDPSGGSSPCGGTSPVLAPAATCTVTVSFGPTAQAIFDESLTVSSAGAPDIGVGLTAVGYDPCPWADVETLTGGPETSTVAVSACLRVETDSYVVGSTGSVTATAGVEIRLGEGTQIDGEFVAALDPFLALP